MGRRQQRPGTELPTRRILMVHRRRAGGCVHLLVVRWRMGSDLAFGREVAGQTPDFHLPAATVEDEIPVVVLAACSGADVRLASDRVSNTQGVGRRR